MNELDKMQRLHQKAVSGEILTAEDQIALQNWYDKLDAEEDLILNNSQPISNLDELRENLAKANKLINYKPTKTLNNIIEDVAQQFREELGLETSLAQKS